MAAADQPLTGIAATAEEAQLLSQQWRRLIRATTLVTVLMAPAIFIWFHEYVGWSFGWSLIATIGAVVAVRGCMDVAMRRVIPWPRLFGVEDAQAREEDVLNRKRASFWRGVIRFVVVCGFIVLPFAILQIFFGVDVTGWIQRYLPLIVQYLVILPPLFLINFLILFGPLVIMGITQMQSFEPGDADWGVKLEHVRGQVEAKEEVRRVVNLWQSGEAFEEAGGKRERGLLFLGAPGTGKTMLSKAIATSFNCPFISMPGSGFAQTFIGMDVVIVRYMARKAKKLARKWGGQCIVFIDEIDAVGRRRQAVEGGGMMTPRAGVDAFEDHCFYGPWGAQSHSGDLILETRAWRERLFAQRADRPPASAGFLGRLGAIVNQGVMPGMMGGMGSLALNQLLVVMDGIDNPPFFRKVFTNKINTFLDACYFIPRRVGSASLRLPTPRPRGDQIYFIGATNVSIDVLDPALTRPGRMGRHVWFRTPTKQDRLDVFDLYITKVAHDTDLDRAERRDEIARITNGYSPAMIEQVCSMALTFAHHDGRERFVWEDLLEAMTTVESGTAINIEYIPEETRAIAIHEAGHAAAAHVYMKGAESTRISIRRRGGALGHHQALEKEERFSSWRSDETARLTWALGAMAAEHVFYRENSTGVGGDVAGATARAAWMVGSCAMAPQAPDLNGSSGDPEALETVEEHFRAIGTQIMLRSGHGAMHDDQINAVLGDRDKRWMVTQFLGEAYMAAYLLMLHNKRAIERIAEQLIARRELYGDELVQILDSANLQVPKVDLTQESAWPTI